MQQLLDVLDTVVDHLRSRYHIDPQQGVQNTMDTLKAYAVAASERTRHRALKREAERMHEHGLDDLDAILYQ